MNITYLFGAGASRNALPIVEEIPTRLKGVIDLLNSDNCKLLDSEYYDIFNVKINKRKAQTELVSDLEWLYTESIRHASIDTLAKKLYVKRQENELKRLKAAFSVFLIFEQTLNSYDKRYDTFFASILNESYYSFPENIRILNWNYDYQFEITYTEYSDQKQIERNQSMLNVVNKFSDNTHINNDRFVIYKLNGTANIVGDNGFRTYDFCPSVFSMIDVEFLDAIIRSHAALRFPQGGLFSGLSFAWERQHSEKNIVSRSIRGTNKTDILVVIGYSFPYFNREIDREIVQAMSNLKRVYFQSPEAENIRDRFLAIRPGLSSDNLVLIHDTKQFFLPDELS